MHNRLPGFTIEKGLRRSFRQGLQVLRDGLPEVRRACRDPAVAREWLRRTWMAPLVVAVLSSFTAVLLPDALESALTAVLPEVTVEQKVLGLFPVERTMPNPNVLPAKKALLLAAWLVIAVAGLLLSIRTLPAAVRSVDAASRRGKATTIAPRRRPEASVRPGAVPGERYVLAGELARGGMGVIHRAVDGVLDRDVAVKELARPLAAKASVVTRFEQEAKALARLVHPNIVQVYDFVTDVDRLWMMIELVDGGDLATLLVESQRIPATEAARMGVQVAGGLAYAHSKGVIHRDVKPSNILLTEDGTAKITDFGIAKLVGAKGQTVAGEVFGSPSYMSPEQASGGEVGPSTDIYSMGATLFEMLTGRPPFEAESAIALASQHVSADVPALSDHLEDVPAGLEELIRSMLAKDPAARPRDMKEAADRLAVFRG